MQWIFVFVAVAVCCHPPILPRQGLEILCEAGLISDAHLQTARMIMEMDSIRLGPSNWPDLYG